ncbi:glycosyltransferase family 1 protein [Streptomyces zhihengii]|uniref:glycosyltransferase family 1 protein n=1 Tax=Streptomyces zhihengii TaxID=1818004 RepID=UPI003624FA5D
MLDPRWIASHHEDFDVFHLHFGFDAQEPERLRGLVCALRRHGKPFVYTVHDLRNPHQRDPAPHEAALDVLIPAADALVTLTPGAAAVIGRRWGREVQVLPHPHVVDFERLAAPRPVRDRFTVGIHAKSLRPNMAVLPVARAVAGAVAELPDAELVVDVHRDAAEPGGASYSPTLMEGLAGLARRTPLRVRVHDYFSDSELYDYLSRLDLSVLPYAFGTHSGWLEACYDLGTAVAAPSCGFYAEQRPCLTYGHTQDEGVDVPSLRAAVVAAYRDRRAPRATVEARRRERADLAAAHGVLYRGTLA